MARDATTISAELDALRAARATGAQRVTVGGRTIEYRTIAEFSEIMRGLEDELVTVTGATKRVRRINVRTDRGL
jgi:hypothetical protein